MTMAMPVTPAKRRLKRGRRPAYTPREDVTLRKLFPSLGTAACAEKLKRRSPASIKQRAAILGLKPPPDQRHQGLKHSLSDGQADAAMAMHNQGVSFAKIGAQFGICEATATNAVRRAECLHFGGTPAKRDSSGAILAKDIARLRQMLREGRKGCDIARALGISANSVSYHRHRYTAALKLDGSSALLPEPGQGAVYSGRKLSAETRREVTDLLLSGLGKARVARETGASPSQVTRIRGRLVKSLARKGQCLAGCAADGKRLVTLKSTCFITPELVTKFRAHLLARVPVRSAALMTAIGCSTAYRLRDALRAELEAEGKTLPEPILPGRQSPSARADTHWLPVGTIYQFRALLETTDFETARRQILEAQAPPISQTLPCLTTPKAATPCRMSFEEQLVRIRNGAQLVEVRPITRIMADITYGGVSSFDG
jgi:uncharacterized protein YerC